MGGLIVGVRVSNSLSLTVGYLAYDPLSHVMTLFEVLSRKYTKLHTWRPPDIERLDSLGTPRWCSAHL